MVNLDITPVEAAYLSLYPPLKDLEVLDLRKNMIGDDGINAIAQSEVLSNLRKLDVRSNLITRVGMMAFAESKTLTNLESLDLRMNKLGKRWEEKIKEKGNFSNLVDVKTV
jgi:Ran GTPase-activating protein (RanGAP) involved in mRNA processing and transport